MFETERIYGGDSSFIYIGNYKMENKKISAEVKCINLREVLESVFADNENKFDLYLEGTVENHKSFVLEGYKSEDQSKKIIVKLDRLAELP